MVKFNFIGTHTEIHNRRDALHFSVDEEDFNEKFRTESICTRSKSQIP